MLRRISTAVVALTLAASGGQAATPAGDQGAPSANQAVSGDQGASAKQDQGFALTIIGDKGTALVNRGTGFSAVAGTTQLKPGDRIMVRDGAAARITYPDGCNVPVRGFATVDPLSPCNFMAADLPSRKGPPPEPYVPSVAEEPFPYLPWRWWPWPVLASRVLSFAFTTTQQQQLSHHPYNPNPRKSLSPV
jgi:hypothetical protein